MLSVNTKDNQLVVGERKKLNSKGLIASDINLSVRNLPKKVFVKIRYNQKEAEGEASICNKGKNLKVVFKEEQEAVTPGQSAVLYDKDAVLGGGVIENIIRR